MGLLDEGQEYLRRSGRNLTGLLEWLGGGAAAGAEPIMGLLRGDAIDEPFLPTADSGGRVGAIASAITNHAIPGPKPAGALGSYGGINSATADKAALKLAKTLEKKGGNAAPDGDIRQQTGWFKDPAGDWQYEISDTAATIRQHPTEPDQYQLDHPLLFSAYPDTANIPIHKLRPDYPGLGWYDGKEVGIRGDLDLGQARSVALHEIGGHAVQDREGFALGSMPEWHNQQSIEMTQPLFDEAKKRMETGEWTLEQAHDWLGEVTKGLMPSDLYRAVLGEYAARDIQARSNYPDWKRQAVPPYSSEKAPPQGWQVRKLPPKGERGGADAAPPLSTDPPDIPSGASVEPPPHPLIGQVFPDQFAASKAALAAGGRNSGLKVTINPDKTATIEAIPGFVHTPAPGAVPPAVAPNTGAVPPSSGWNTVVGPSGGPPAGGRLPPAPSVDRRGLSGRDPLGPRNPIPGLLDPEGRPLYQDAIIAGVRQPGGDDVPLTMLEEIALAKILSHGDFRTPMGMAGANGGVNVRVPGTMDPPAPPHLTVQVDASKNDQTYMNAVRHEVGHAIDYWGERTQRGKDTGFRQYEIPQDVRGELEKASVEMRPHLWGEDRDVIMQRSKAVVDEYRERPDELIADGKRFYKEDPAGFKAKYPNAAAYIRAQVNDDPLLSQHIQFNVTAPSGGLLAPFHDDEQERR